MLYLIFKTLFTFIRVVEIVTLVYCVLSWIMPGSVIFALLGRFLEPIARPFRALSRALMGRFNLPIDFSLFFMLIGLDIVRALLSRLYYFLL